MFLRLPARSDKKCVTRPYLQSMANAHRRFHKICAPGTIKRAEKSASEEELGQNRRLCAPGNFRPVHRRSS